MNDNCHICKSKSSFFMNKDGFVLYRCPSCHLVFMNPLPEQSFLNTDIYSIESGYQSNKAKDLSVTVPVKKTKDILNFLQKINLGKKILDVGCSNGEFLYHAKKSGFESFGVELNKRTADIAVSNGIRVFNGLLQNAGFENNFFDVIFLGDIIEHVLSPRDFIKECNRLIHKNGIIIISTPNLDCLWSRFTLMLFKIFGIPWSSVTPPYHTFQFSENNLDILMSEQGFKKEISWFYKPPRLMYELGSLHLLKKYKNQKTIKNLFFMLYAFSAYSITYLFVVCTGFFRRKDFSMISIYKKNE